MKLLYATILMVNLSSFDSGLAAQAEEPLSVKPEKTVEQPVDVVRAETKLSQGKVIRSCSPLNSPYFRSSYPSLSPLAGTSALNALAQVRRYELVTVPKSGSHGESALFRIDSHTGRTWLYKNLSKHNANSEGEWVLVHEPNDHPVTPDHLYEAPAVTPMNIPERKVCP